MFLDRSAENRMVNVIDAAIVVDDGKGKHQCRNPGRLVCLAGAFYRHCNFSLKFVFIPRPTRIVSLARRARAGGQAWLKKLYLYIMNVAVCQYQYFKLLKNRVK